MATNKITIKISEDELVDGILDRIAGDIKARRGEFTIILAKFIKSRLPR